ncbi:hypothetical protein BOTBODRAFT_39019 [Botryobasidium botryosum FD-172 SS1]|uniref:Uncharacterized protein n=1 Tax=Botryobasidium botryosum (strain FD-172 SS1) TaxID=930990 RepID=A0A067M5N0_BOTB1|nr:hypothetical protein BOTBODRAFT_39019 [Botryobasidium botryosum FD-172 SS1]
MLVSHRMSPVVKRKYDAYESSDSSDGGLPDFRVPRPEPESDAPRGKRLRHHGLERGLASLSLVLAASPPSAPGPSQPPQPAQSPAPTPQPQQHVYDAMDSDDDDVQMKKVSWYEPEKDRIVVLDLDLSDDESDPRPETTPAATSSDNPSYEISPAAIASLPPLFRPIKYIPESDSRALVLFRPSPWALPPEAKGDPEPSDDDRMDIDS